MFGKILVGIDGTDTSRVTLLHAMELANAMGSQVLIASAYPPSHSHRHTGNPGATVSIAKAALRDARNSVGETVPVSTRALEGPAAASLAALALEEGVDLTVVGNRGMKGLGRFSFGNVADLVSHRVSTHLLMVNSQSTGKTRIERILAGTDGSPTAERAVDLGASLASNIQATFTVVTVSRSEEMGQRALEPARARFPLADTRVLSGDPAKAISQFSAEGGYDLIVVGNKGMKGPRRFLVGSIPDKLSHLASTSLLIARTA